ncbi:hypothetical protein CDAR_492591 [Caerostris darwini]|uniref:Uncharacterized protein n=1 Tax=Caerostris darwini TaxID=1538125 RepID=A0AAV4UZH9_9ARAC|nr:hypothetical protein CDAR_492591 [Caerostris darwini]
MNAAGDGNDKRFLRGRKEWDRRNAPPSVKNGNTAQISVWKSSGRTPLPRMEEVHVSGCGVFFFCKAAGKSEKQKENLVKKKGGASNKVKRGTESFIPATVRDRPAHIPGALAVHPSQHPASCFRPGFPSVCVCCGGGRSVP